MNLNTIVEELEDAKSSLDYQEEIFNETKYHLSTIDEDDFKDDSEKEEQIAYLEERMSIAENFITEDKEKIEELQKLQNELTNV